MSKDGASASGFHFLSDYKKCQRYFQLRYMERLVRKFQSTKLIYGKNIHLALEEWYRMLKAGHTLAERKAEMLKVFSNSMQDSRPAYVEEEYFNADCIAGVQTLEAYADRWTAEGWNVLAIEQELETKLPGGATLTGRVDLVIEDFYRSVYVVDHKTTGWSIDMLTRTLQISDQTSAYIVLWNANNPKKKAHGAIYNILRKNKSVIDFARPPILKCDEDIEDFVADAQDTFDEIAWRIAENRRWNCNKSSCMAFNRPCDYYEICTMPNSKRLLIDSLFTIETDLKPMEDDI
jgi:hypothetical protein